LGKSPRTEERVIRATVLRAGHCRSTRNSGDFSEPQQLTLRATIGHAALFGPYNDGTSGPQVYRILLSATICSNESWAAEPARHLYMGSVIAAAVGLLHCHQLEGEREEHDARRSVRTSLSSSRDTFQFVRGQFACLLRRFALNMFVVGHNTGSVRFEIEGRCRPTLADIRSHDRDIHHEAHAIRRPRCDLPRKRLMAESENPWRQWLRIDGDPLKRRCKSVLQSAYDDDAACDKVEFIGSHCFVFDGS
jgi:hypothetical protein